MENPDPKSIRQTSEVVKPKVRKLGKNSKWQRLKTLFLTKRTTIGNPKEHIFSFKTFLNKKEDEKHFLYNFTFLPDCELKIPKPEASLSLDTVSKTSNQRLDTTGFLMWPSEEILAISMLHMFRQIFKLDQVFETGWKKLRILEIGAGYSGLCGIALGHWLSRRRVTHPDQFKELETVEIVITDGVEPCVEKI